MLIPSISKHPIHPGTRWMLLISHIYPKTTFLTILQLLLCQSVKAGKDLWWFLLEASCLQQLSTPLTLPLLLVDTKGNFLQKLSMRQSKKVGLWQYLSNSLKWDFKSRHHEKVWTSKIKNSNHSTSPFVRETNLAKNTTNIIFCNSMLEKVIQCIWSNLDVYLIFGNPKSIGFWHFLTYIPLFDPL